MTRETALHRVAELLGLSDNGAALIAYQDEISALSVAVLGKSVRRCNCKDRYQDALIEIYRHLKNNNKMKSEIKARLRRGIVLTINGKHYTSLNITDEVARAYLKEYPHQKKWFEVLPPAEEKPEVDMVTEANEEKYETAAEAVKNEPKPAPKKTAKKSKK